MAEEGTEAEEDVAPTVEAHQQYLDDRKELVDAARESARTFDKAVLTFGSAIFGFSIAFLKDVAPHPASDTLLWLGAAWFLFAFGLLLILLSFLFSHRACMFEIECATKKIADPNCETQNNRWSTITDRCNFACIAFLFLGLISWSVFAFQNLGREGSATMNKVQEPTEKRLRTAIGTGKSPGTATSSHHTAADGKKVSTKPRNDTPGRVPLKEGYVPPRQPPAPRHAPPQQPAPAPPPKKK